MLNLVPQLFLTRNFPLNFKIIHMKKKKKLQRVFVDGKCIINRIRAEDDAFLYWNYFVVICSILLLEIRITTFLTSIKPQIFGTALFSMRIFNWIQLNSIVNFQKKWNDSICACLLKLFFCFFFKKIYISKLFTSNSKLIFLHCCL